MKKRAFSLFSALLMMCSMMMFLPNISISASATQSKSGNFAGGYTLTGNGADDIVAVAQKQVGKTQSQLGYTEAWCADFVCDCAKLAKQSTAVPLYGGCEGLYDRVIKAGGRKVSSQQKGDLIFYYCTKTNHPWLHVGLAIDSKGGMIQGNFSSKVQKYSTRVYICPFCGNNHANDVRIVRPAYKNTSTTVTFYRNLDSSDTNKVRETFTTGVNNQRFGYTTEGEGRYREMNDPDVGFGLWTKAGYDLLGWSKSRTATTSSWRTYSNVADYWIVENSPAVDLYAVWKPHVYKVSFISDDIHLSDTIDVAYATEYGELPDLGSDNSEFEGWFTDDGIQITKESVYTATTDQTLFAHWKSHDYGDWTVTTPATCESDGEMTRKCNSCDKTETQTIPATGHNYTTKTIAPTAAEQGYDLHTCTNCGDSYKDNFIDPISQEVPELTWKADEEKVTLKWGKNPDAEKYGIVGYANGKWNLLDECYTISYELKNLKPGKKYKVAVIAMYNSKWNKDYSNAVEFIVPISIPKISYETTNGSVKLSWTAVRTAEKYGIFEYKNDYWNMVDQTTDTSYVLNNLESGSEHKIAVLTYFDGKWNMDYSNAVDVVVSIPHEYPKPVSIDYNEQFHQFRISWTPVKNAEQYGIAVNVAGKWRPQAYFNAKTTVFTSPKLTPGSKFKMVICAKVNGEWDISSLLSRVINITIK